MHRIASRIMSLKSISRVCFPSFCEVEFRNVERLKVARKINQNIFRIFPVLFYFSDFPFGFRFSLFAIVFDFMFSKTRRTQIVLYRDLNFSRLLSFVYFLEMLPPNWVTFLRVRGSREYRPPCINLFPSYSFLMSPRFILWFGERKRERERERESENANFL